VTVEPGGIRSVLDILWKVFSFFFLACVLICHAQEYNHTNSGTGECVGVCVRVSAHAVYVCV
jgi:hypothetical protein